MFSVRFWVLICCLVGTSFPSLASDERSALKVGFGFDKPPYVIQYSQSGFYIDVMREALSRMGYRMEPSFVSLSRMEVAMVGGFLDVVTGLPKDVAGGTCFSTPFVMYENVAFYQKDAVFNLESVSDLQFRNIIAFQRAAEIIGGDFEKIAKTNPNYFEVASQVSQVKSFLAGRNEVAVMDRNIFYWVAKQILGADALQQKKQEIKEARLFQWTMNHGAAFHDEKLCMSFDQAISSMKQDGTFSVIRGKYLTD